MESESKKFKKKTKQRIPCQNVVKISAPVLVIKMVCSN
jgi:hypothetical protein